MAQKEPRHRLLGLQAMAPAKAYLAEHAHAVQLRLDFPQAGACQHLEAYLNLLKFHAQVPKAQVHHRKLQTQLSMCALPCMTKSDHSCTVEGSGNVLAKEPAANSSETKALC